MRVPDHPGTRTRHAASSLELASTLVEHRRVRESSHIRALPPEAAPDRKSKPQRKGSQLPAHKTLNRATLTTGVICALTATSDSMHEYILQVPDISAATTPVALLCIASGTMLLATKGANRLEFQWSGTLNLKVNAKKKDV
ncbi:hypothetical protein ACN20G_33375 (plasmid) [Streptomyces sp. BI20]|uniref:hypothetical protein n=1 Tax=Streptomyces sp. BI20 TaxID=3403460 RepID=UPI003C708971